MFSSLKAVVVIEGSDVSKTLTSVTATVAFIAFVSSNVLMKLVVNVKLTVLRLSVSSSGIKVVSVLFEVTITDLDEEDKACSVVDVDDEFMIMVEMFFVTFSKRPDVFGHFGSILHLNSIMVLEMPLKRRKAKVRLKKRKKQRKFHV